MRWLRFLNRRAQARDRADEMRAHLELLTEQLIARGRSPEQAAREARLEFGNPRVKLEEVEAMNRIPVVETLALDARNAWRSLRAAPAFAAIVLAVLTLAMGATTAVFSVVDAVALRGLPFDAGDRLVAFDMTIKGKPASRPLTPMDFLAMRGVDAFAGVAAVTMPEALELRRTAADDPSALVSERVTAEFFPVLRASPALGRAFTMDDEAAGARVAVISDSLWRRRFGGAVTAIGAHLPGASGDIEVIGVMPRGFSYPVGAAKATEVWMPWVATAQERTSRFRAYLFPIGRLRDGATIDQAHARIDALDLPISPKGVDVPGREGRLTLRPLRDSIVGDMKPAMLMLLAAVGCVLLVACANIANLGLVRASARAHELRVRASLGASAWDIARLLVAESVMLSAAGTLLGLGLAWWAIGALPAVLPDSLPRMRNIGIDARVLGVSAVAALLTGLVVSLAPLFQAIRATGGVVRAGSGHTASRRSHRIRAAFLVAEMALAAVLLVGTALFLASFMRLTRLDLGMDYRNVLLLDIRRGDGVELNRIAEAVRRIPGVSAASVARGSVPLSFSYTTRPLSGPGITPPVPNHGVDTNGVSADYFRALGTPVLRGRAFTDADVASNAAVVILNEHAANTYFPDQDPVGRVVDFGGTRTVVGVVADVHLGGPYGGVRDGAFLPITGWDRKGGALIVKTSRDPRALEAEIKGTVWSFFPELVIPPAETMAARYGFTIGRWRLNTILMSLFGVLAVAIAGVGIYGVMMHVVSRHTREIGIRMALGARPGRILRSVLRHAAAQVAAGFAIGAMLAWWLSRLIEPSLLFNGEPHDLRLYAIVGGVLATVALAAAYAPARRAARVDPLIALRRD